MTKLTDTRTVTGAQTIVGIFASRAAARGAVQQLQRAGMPPDRIGIVDHNVRQAREIAGSYSPQAALAGAMLGAILVVGYVVFGGEQIRQSPFAVAMGAFAIVGGLTLIGWLAGRGRVLKEEEYDDYEDKVEEGEALVSVVCDTSDGADRTRDVLTRANAREVRVEDTGESV